VNVPGWHEVPLRRQLERRLSCRCLVDNDVNLFTLGEFAFGAGRGARQLVGLTLGTGLGGGLIFNGALYRGSRGAAGEVGHMVIDPRGNRCGCGARGCLEAQVATAAILRMGRRAIRRGAGPLRTLSRRARGRLTPELVSQAARRGDAAARQIWREVGRSLGIGLGNVVNLLNPDRIVIGGGIANAWEWFYPSLITTVRAQAMEVSARSVQVVRARLGKSAGVVGAAVLVWHET
jgi:glucokinase